MLGEDIKGACLQSHSSHSGSISQVKRSLKQNASPTSPLSCGSFDLTINDGVDDSINKLYHNIYDMQSSDKSQSMQSLTTYGKESIIDSELRRLVGAETGREEEIKEVVVVEHLNTGSSKMPNRKKPGNIAKASTPRVEGKSSNVRIMSQKLLVGKRNPTKSSRRSMSLEERGLKNVNVLGREDNEKGTDNPDLGPYLLKKARDLISSGDIHKKAFDLVIRAKKCFENSIYDKPSLDYVMCLHILASMYCSAGQRREAIPILERAIDVPNIEFGQNHALAKFVGCMKLGDIYAMIGQIEKSIVKYKEGLEVQISVLGEKDTRVGGTCRYVAEAYVQAFEFDEAKKHCQMALDIHKENGSLSIDEAGDRRLMGLICDAKGNYEAALEHYVLARTAICSSGQDYEVAALDCSIGDVYVVLGRYEEAILSYNKALATFKANKGKNHPSVASVFVCLAELYNKVGKFGESKSYCGKALEIYSKQSSPDNMEDIANGLTDLAAIYESMNELHQALNLLKRALELYSNISSQNNTTAGIEAQVGVLYCMMGNYSECYNHLKSSISMFEASGEKKSSLYGITLNQLGLACVQLYKISEASELFEQALTILEKEYGSYHPDTLGVYSNLACTYDALGRWGDAIDLFEYVVLMREEKLGTADPVVDDEKCRLAELLKEARKTRKRNSRSLGTLLDKNPCAIMKNVTRLI